jgi:hypothetical protein
MILDAHIGTVNPLSECEISIRTKTNRRTISFADHTDNGFIGPPAQL